MLVGDTRDLPPPLVGRSATGLLRGHDSGEVERWLDAAIASALVGVSQDAYRTLRLTDAGREVLAGRGTDVRITARPRLPSLASIRRAQSALGRFERWR
jgi:hypothetical protein